MDEDEIKEYLKQNLYLEIKSKPYHERFCSAKQEITVELWLDDSMISEDKVWV